MTEVSKGSVKREAAKSGMDNRDYQPPGIKEGETFSEYVRRKRSGLVIPPKTETPISEKKDNDNTCLPGGYPGESWSSYIKRNQRSEPGQRAAFDTVARTEGIARAEEIFGERDKLPD